MGPITTSLKALTQIMRNEFMAVVRRQGDLHMAHCPEIPEAMAESSSKLGAIAALRVAIVQILDQRRQEAARELLAGAEFDVISLD